MSLIAWDHICSLACRFFLPILPKKTPGNVMELSLPIIITGHFAITAWVDFRGEPRGLQPPFFL